MSDTSNQTSANTSLTTLKNGVVAINTIATNVGNLFLFAKGQLLFRGAMTTSTSTLFTVQSGSQYTVTDIEIANTSAGSLTYSVYLVPSGGTAAASNALFGTNSIAANTTFQWKGAQVIQAGGTIQAIGSATTLTIHITGGQG
jgi:hypothetical protein